MTHKNRNPLITAVIEAARKQRIEAGTARDGTAAARCEAVITVLHAMRNAAPDGSARRAKIQDEYSRAVKVYHFCKIHDQFARGEIDCAEYGQLLNAARKNR